MGRGVGGLTDDWVRWEDVSGEESGDGGVGTREDVWDNGDGDEMDDGGRVDLNVLTRTCEFIHTLRFAGCGPREEVGVEVEVRRRSGTGASSSPGQAFVGTKTSPTAPVRTSHSGTSIIGMDAITDLARCLALCVAIRLVHGLRKVGTCDVSFEREPRRVVVEVSAFVMSTFGQAILAWDRRRPLAGGAARTAGGTELAVRSSVTSNVA